MIHRKSSMLVCLAGAVGLSTALSTSALASTAPAAGGASGANVAAAAPRSSSTFVRVFSNSPTPQGALTTEDIQPTSDGGHIVLADTGTANGVEVSWLLKLDSTGSPQFQKEVGCFNAAPGDNALAHSVMQTSDGGYILGGGTVGCGSAASACPQASGISCGYVVKLDSAGDVVWANVYNDGAQNADISQIKQTSDGGYVAVGSADVNTNGNTAGLVLKLDSSGNVQFQREFAPSGSTTNIQLNAVRQSSDGGFITAGQFTVSGGSTIGNVLAIKLSSAGAVQFENGYEHVVGGVTVDRETVTSVIQTSDGGFLVGGDWNTSNGTNPNGPRGGLLLKLTSAGAIQSQHSYTNTLPNGDIIGSEINSVGQLPSGGFLLAGASDLLDSTKTVVLGLVPYVAETDSSGNLTQQTLYTELSSVGRPTSSNFAGANLLSNGGALDAGFTEDPASGIGDLYLVQTNSALQVGTRCGNQQSAPALVDGLPSLAPVNVGSTVQTTVNAAASSPTTVVTGIPTFTTSC